VAARTRRAFLSSAALAVSGAGVLASSEAEDMTDRQHGLHAEIDRIPDLCVHEHWGSLPAIGAANVGFVADEYAGASSPDVSLFDLLFDPYLHGFLAAGGFDTAALATELGCADIRAAWRKHPAEVLAATLPHLENQRSVGTLTCLTAGVRLLYEFDLDDLSPANGARISGRIAANYGRIFDWYLEARAKGRLLGPARPVSLSFMCEAQNTDLARQELSFTRPILRIDEYLAPLSAGNPRMRYSSDRVGVQPTDAASWREFLRRVFEVADGAGCVAIKQLQAYSRDLDFRLTPDADVRFAPDTPEEMRAHQDWVVHECCKLANERGWPFQIHVGTNNLPRPAPLPLAALMDAYPRVRFVLIHCWPYIDEAAYLAKYHPNAFIDTCWLPVLSPAHLERALSTYIGYVPAHKVMMSQDATSVEMAVGAAAVSRRILAKVLAERVADGLLDEPQALRLARRMLHDNADETHGMGYGPLS